MSTFRRTIEINCLTLPIEGVNQVLRYMENEDALDSRNFVLGQCPVLRGEVPRKICPFAGGMEPNCSLCEMRKDTFEYIKRLTGKKIGGKIQDWKNYKEYCETRGKIKEDETTEVMCLRTDKGVLTVMQGSKVEKGKFFISARENKL